MTKRGAGVHPPPQQKSGDLDEPNDPVTTSDIDITPVCSVCPPDGSNRAEMHVPDGVWVPERDGLHEEDGERVLPWPEGHIYDSPTEAEPDHYTVHCIDFCGAGGVTVKA